MSQSLKYRLPNLKYVLYKPCAWLTLLLFACLFAFYAIFYKYHFYWQEQNQIFLNTDYWLRGYFEKPAWLASMAGEWLTQYYYYEYAGPAILSLVLTLTVCLLFGVLKSSLPKSLCYVITAFAAIWLVGCSFDAGCRLDSLLCFFGGVFIYRIVKPIKLWSLVFIPLAYWTFGFGDIILGALCIIGSLRRRTVMIIITAVLAALLVAFTPFLLKDTYSLKYSQAIVYPSFPTPTLPEWEVEHTLAVENEYYFGNYDMSIEKALQMSEPNVETAFYFYLSQAKRDSLSDYLLSYPLKDLGTLNEIGENTPLPVINMMNDLYYELGDMMYAERAAMMRNVFSGRNRNARMVKRLAEVNLVSGDTAAALKYLRILDKTAAYKDWAKAYMPGGMNESAKRDISRRQLLKNTQDTMRLGDNCRTILIELLNSNPKNTLALDYLLCTDLLLKEMDTFKADYDRYCMDTGSPRLKPLYQQALMIYLAGTDAPQEQWDRYIVNQKEMDRFMAYNRARGSEAFKDTYWYYFDKVKR